MYPNKYVSKLIVNAIEDEIMAERVYNNLCEMLYDIDDKKILKEIAIDEEKHTKMLKELYTEINGSYADLAENKNEMENNPLECIAKAIKEETESVEKYRTLLFAFEKPEYKNMIMEIIFDEQNHAAKLNYLYSKNK